MCSATRLIRGLKTGIIYSQVGYSVGIDFAIRMRKSVRNLVMGLGVVVAALAAANIPTISAEVSMVPKNLMKLEGSAAKGMLKLSDVLEEHDDVQNVYSNFDVDESELEGM